MYNDSRHESQFLQQRVSNENENLPTPSNLLMQMLTALNYQSNNDQTLDQLHQLSQHLKQLPSNTQQSNHAHTISQQNQLSQSIPQGSAQDDDMQRQPVTEQQSIQEQPVESIPLGTARNTGKQSEIAIAEPLRHFPCPQVFENRNNCDTTNEMATANTKDVARNDDKSSSGREPSTAKEDIAVTKAVENENKVYWDGGYYPIEMILKRRWKGRKWEYEVLWEDGVTRNWVPEMHIPQSLYEKYNKENPKPPKKAQKKPSKKRALTDPKQNPMPAKLSKPSEKKVSQTFEYSLDRFPHIYYLFSGW
jgi:hypothetical protein